MSHHPLEFIGMISHRHASEIHPPAGPILDPGYVVRFARAHEDGGFDRILVAWHSTHPDALLVARHAAANTTRIGFMVAAHPPAATSGASCAEWRGQGRPLPLSAQTADHIRGASLGPQTGS